jgi:hypothetical protein
MPALGSNATFHLNETLSDKVWKMTGAGVEYTDNGGTFTVAQSGDSPKIQSEFYIFWGRATAIMKAAKGRGIVSSFIMQSEDLDEIDWEFLGGNTTHVMTNFFGKGNTTDFTRGKEYPTVNPQEDFHNYTINWTKERIEWWMDGKLFRTLKAEEAPMGGKEYPQTPMTVRLGAWAGGDKDKNSKGVVEWAGGETNFKEGPFIMDVKEVYVEDYTSAKEYQWTDKTGSWQSIKVVNGTSEAIKEITKPSGIKNRWNALSHGAKIAIVASVVGVLAIGACVFIFCFFKLRRRGRREYLNHQAEQNKEAAELLEYKRQMSQGRFSQGNPAYHKGY